jgi:hypothetical protein
MLQTPGRDIAQFTGFKWPVTFFKRECYGGVADAQNFFVLVR